jgi:hypothetical protein
MYEEFWQGKMNERGLLEETGVGGSIILKWSTRNRKAPWTGLTWLRIGQVAAVLNTVIKFQVP